MIFNFVQFSEEIIKKKTKIKNSVLIIVYVNLMYIKCKLQETVIITSLCSRENLNSFGQPEIGKFHFHFFHSAYLDLFLFPLICATSTQPSVSLIRMSQHSLSFRTNLWCSTESHMLYLRLSLIKIYKLLPLILSECSCFVNIIQVQ